MHKHTHKVCIEISYGHFLHPFYLHRELQSQRIENGQDERGAEKESGGLEQKWRSRIDRPTLIILTYWTAFKSTATRTVSCAKGHRHESTFTRHTGVLRNIRTLGMDYQVGLDHKKQQQKNVCFKCPEKNKRTFFPMNLCDEIKSNYV